MWRISLLLMLIGACSSGGGDPDGGLPDGSEDGGDGYNDDPVEMLYLGTGYTELRREPLSSYEEVRQD